jgi:hypothetical protein
VSGFFISDMVKNQKLSTNILTPTTKVVDHDLEDADNSCKSLVRKGFVLMSDIKFPLPYLISTLSCQMLYII